MKRNPRTLTTPTPGHPHPQQRLPNAERSGEHGSRSEAIPRKQPLQSPFSVAPQIRSRALRVSSARLRASSAGKRPSPHPQLAEILLSPRDPLGYRTCNAAPAQNWLPFPHASPAPLIAPLHGAMDSLRSYVLGTNYMPVDVTVNVAVEFPPTQSFRETSVAWFFRDVIKHLTLVSLESLKRPLLDVVPRALHWTLVSQFPRRQNWGITF